jgi:hypothetical protein
MVHAFVFAPPGSGKSTFVARQPKTADWIEDGDDVIAATIGWPDGEWWHDDILSVSFSNRAAFALVEYMHAARKAGDDLVIVLAGFPYYDDLILKSRADIYHWVPEYSVNFARLKKRERQNPDRPKITMHELANARRKIRNYGRRLDRIEEIYALKKEWFV